MLLLSQFASFSPGASFFITLMMLIILLKSRWAGFVLDHPNQRSLHTAPVPRTGGLALMLGVAMGWLMLLQSGLWPLLVMAGLLLAVSLWDDMYSLPVKWRLVAHGIGAIWFVLWVQDGNIGGFGLAGAVLAIIWMTNLYNFMDGSDGLAGGMALFGFGCYGFAAWMGGDESLALACFSISAAAGAFLVFNFHPARIFMGDAGSISLGFLAAVLGLIGWGRGLWPVWMPVLVFSPFVVDTSVTLLKRLLRGEKIWQAHREHYYQRLVQMGLGHRHTALWEYALMIATGLSACWGATQPLIFQLVLLFIWGFIYIGLMRVIDVKWKHFSSRQVDRG